MELPCLKSETNTKEYNLSNGQSIKTIKSQSCWVPWFSSGIHPSSTLSSKYGHGRPQTHEWWNSGFYTSNKRSYPSFNMKAKGKFIQRKKLHSTGYTSRIHTSESSWSYTEMFINNKRFPYRGNLFTSQEVLSIDVLFKMLLSKAAFWKWVYKQASENIKLNK